MTLYSSYCPCSNTCNTLLITSYTNYYPYSNTYNTLLITLYSSYNIYNALSIEEILTSDSCFF